MKKLLLPKCIVLALSVSTLLSSCISTKNQALSNANRLSLKGKTVVVTTRTMPEHSVLKQSAMTAGVLTGAIGGAVVGGMAAHEGKQQVRKHNIPDPTKTIISPISRHLASRTGCKITVANSTTNKLKPADVAAQNAQSDYVLDIMTTSWMGTYYPMSFSKYYMTYGAKMNLIETKTGKVIAEGFHFYQGNDKANAPNYDGIYANGAAFLRSETKKGTDAATHVFKSQL